MKREQDKPTSGQLGPKSARSKNKLRSDSTAAKPSDRLRHEDETPSGTSGQVGPKSGGKGKADKKAAKDTRRMDKSKLRFEKTGDKMNATRAKLAKQKPQKRPGAIKTLRQAAGFEVWAKAHSKIHQAEHENVGVEAAHHAELYGERAGRAGVRFVKQRNRTRPARRAAKTERKHIKASADYRFRQMAQENPELKNSAVNRYLQKRRLRKQYQKQAKETAKAAKKTGEKAVSAIEKAGRAVVNFVKRHPTGVLIALLCLLLILILQSCMGGALTIGNGLVGAVGGTSYLAEDADIDEAELRYTEWEVDLELRAINAQTSHPGYDEYRYSLAAVGHDPYAMLAYLTAKHDDFTFAAVQAELQSIFNQQYSLTFTPSVEIRYRTETYTDPETGESTDYEVPYNWYVLTVTLTARPFDSVISPLLTTQDERDRYEIYMFLHGNRQYVGSPFDFQWLPSVSCYYGYRVHPITKVKDYHSGADIAVPTGTPIQAGGDGVVLESGNNGGYGLTVLVDYGDGISARYAHCSSLLVGAGQTVGMGDVIALSGNTGTSTGPHLHMEVIKDGRYLNPLYFVDGTIIF